MTSQRQSASNRTKQLRLAIFRIERGRTKTGARKLSIAAAAREMGVTPALIRNQYPEVAETIRTKLGASIGPGGTARAERDLKRCRGFLTQLGHDPLKVAQ